MPATPVFVDFRDRPFARPGTDAVRDQRPAPLRDFGPWLPQVTVGIEDHRFWRHRGVDWTATTGALLRNARNLRVVSGASTITQQTVKILTGRTRRTIGEKLREAVSALAVERTWSKERILETYLNRIDYGNRRFGAEAAAQAYFGKSASTLTLAEAIFLAGLPQSPTRLNPWFRPEAALARYRQNVRHLARVGALPPEANADALLANPPRVERHDPETRAPHFVQLAQNRVPNHEPGTTNQEPIRTTLDLDLQHVAETLLREHLRNAASLGIGDAAIVVVENATGAIRALACAGRAEHAAINSAVTPRSAGSTLKPFIYAEAIERRLVTAASLLPDTPQAIPETYADYDPQNYTQRSYGPVRVREALGNSLNVPAVLVTSKIGARDAFHALQRWGFSFPRSFDAYGAGFVLGNADIRLVDLAAAYASLARGGLVWPARAVAGESFESRHLVSPETCAIVTDILCDNDARRLSFGLNSPLDLGARVAVKTGTSSGFRDRWCVGFSRDHTVAVWAGNLDGKSMGEVLAVRAAAPLWASLMRHLLAQGDEPLPPPLAPGSTGVPPVTSPSAPPEPRLLPLRIATETGLLPRPGEPTLNEFFLPGTEPTASAATLYADIDGRSTLVLPPEYAAWCASPQNRLGAVARSREFEIVFPRNGATFAWSPVLPRAQQILTPLSTVPVTEWLLNGETLPRPEIPLAPGDYRLTARSAGEERTATFTVE